MKFETGRVDNRNWDWSLQGGEGMGGRCVFVSEGNIINVLLYEG